jgi:hypothetical protein
MHRGNGFTRGAVVFAVLSAIGAQASPARVVAAAEPAPYYEQLLPVCQAQMGVPDDPCHMPGNETDAPGIVIVKCDTARGVTNFCYDVTVDGGAAPPELRILGYLTAYKLHDASVRDAQLEANIVAFRVPQGATLAKGELWGWGKRPADQSNGGGGKVDLSPVLTENSVVKVVLRYKAHRMPQYSVLAARDGTMNFSMNGQDLTVTLEGKPARVAIESATQHIDFDTEKSDDTTKPWTDRCGIPSMQFVVCNVDRAESNPLLFYARSSSFVNAPGADVPGPIWTSTNATYFHQPSVSSDAKGNKQLQVKVAAPHLLADGTTVNSGSFSTFLPNGLLEQWKIDRTQAGLDRALAASVKKNGTESVLERTFTITDLGVLIKFPNLTYSSPEVYVTSVANTGGNQNANQIYQALIAPAVPKTGTTTNPSSSTAPFMVNRTTWSVKAKSLVQPSKLITVPKGYRVTWKVTGTGCTLRAGRVYTVKAGRPCKLTQLRTNTKTGLKTSKTVTVRIT